MFPRYHALAPPSTLPAAPLTKLLSLLSRKVVTLANSSALPSHAIGVNGASVMSWTRAMFASRIRVSTTPLQCVSLRLAMADRGDVREDTVHSSLPLGFLGSTSHHSKSCMFWRRKRAPFLNPWRENMLLIWTNLRVIFQKSRPQEMDRTLNSPFTFTAMMDLNWNSVWLVWDVAFVPSLPEHSYQGSPVSDLH